MAARSSNRYAPPPRARTDSQLVLRFAVVSFLGHIALFVMILFSGAFLPEKHYIPSVIDVRMVSLAPKAPAAGPPRSAPAPTPPPVEASAPEPQETQPESPPPAAVELEAPEPAAPKAPEPAQEAPVSIAPKPKEYREKTSLKEKTYTPKPVVKPPEKRPPKQSPPKESPARSEQVKAAIEKLRKSLQMPPPGSPARGAAVGAGGARGTEGGAAGWSSGGEAGGDLIDVYKAEIASRIQKNWAFSEQLTGGMKDLQAVIVMKILPDGEIGDIWFEKHSGNSLLDDSAFRAVQKSNPLPPLPKGYFRAFYLVGLIFTPEGIQ